MPGERKSIAETDNGGAGGSASEVFFAAMQSKAEAQPDFEVVTFENHIYPDEVLTYSDLVIKGDKLAQALSQSGIGRGDSFAIAMRNHPEMPIAMYAASAVGAILVPIDPRSKGEKLRFQISNSGAKGVLCTADLLDPIESALAELPSVKVVGVAHKDGLEGDGASKYASLNEILDGAEAPGVALHDHSGEDPLMMIHTSGTTGNPKGVVLRQGRVLGGAIMARAIWGYTSEDRLYTGLSLTHGNAIAVTLIPALQLSIPAVISQRFTKSRIWDICRKHGCTTYSLLGGMMMGIYSEPPKPNDSDNPVRKVISAGTPAPIWEAFEKRFNVRIHEWYAAVEGGFAHNPPGSGPVGSFGKPIEASLEIRVVREDDTECGPGEVGELISRPVGGESKVEYHKNPEASEAKTRGGWLRSGDMVHRDAEGWLYFDFRKGGGLRRQGDFIMPEHVEGVVAEHPQISDVCVYGVPAETQAPGESDLVAAVVLVPGETLDVKGVFAVCVAGLERNSVPSFLQIVEEIPKTNSEKNLTRVLRAEFEPDSSSVYRFEDYV